VPPPQLPPSLRDAPEGGVFFLHGQDRFQRAEALDALVDTYVDPATRDFNLDRLRGTEVDVESLASILATPPMMAEFRVVVVTEVEALVGSVKAREVLLNLAATPPPGLAAILEADIPPGSKAKVYRTLKTACRAAEFPAVSQDDVPGWLMGRAREAHDRELEPDAARALGAAVGNDLGVLARELEKLSDMVDDGEPITVEQVEAAGTTILQQDRWKWFDLVGEKRFAAALEGLSILLARGESAVSLTIGLATHFLRLGVLVEDGASALEQVLPPHQKWLARRLSGQARRWSPSEVEAAVMELRRLDQLLKASPLPPEHLLEEWLLGVMVRAREAA
jgi:DNA polymerase-3 subunit delta